MEIRNRSSSVRRWEGKALAAIKALCLVGFPAVPMLVYLSRRHPSLSGVTAAQQIDQLAAAATRWAQVHFAFSVGGFLALAAVLILRREVATKAPELWTNAAAAIGVIGGVIFTGTVLMEVSVIPALSRACAASPACLHPDNAVFSQELANQGWRVLPGLGLGGRTLMAGIALIALLGILYGSLRNWEGAALFFGAILEIGNDTGLHAWGNFEPASGMPGLAALALLAGGAGVGWRLLRGIPPGAERPAESIATEPALDTVEVEPAEAP
ncbi:MAG TPA: hypothetical protein VHJ78_12820 [Actinomycetota bacterium]|nr:hypothetical protein [Actinomycetota bacterium]